MDRDMIDDIIEDELSALSKESTTEAYHRSRNAKERDEGVERGFGYRGELPKATVASPSSCELSCETCSQHYRPLEHQKWAWLQYTKVYSDAEAAKVTHELVENSRSNLNYVRQKLDLHGNAIAKRWQKRSADKRAALLLAAKPEMYKRKHLPVDLFYRVVRQYPGEWHAHHFLWLLPYLDLPTLSENAHNLLSLLHNRTKHSPSEWALYDSEQMNNPFTEGAVKVPYNPHAVVMHGPAYGWLVPWEKEAAHLWDAIGFPRAHLILEAQSVLSDFLKKIIDLIIGAEAAEGNDKWLQLMADDFNSPLDHEIAGSYVDRFFMAPPQFNLERLVEVLQDRIYAAEDELYLMQTDPFYVREFLTRVRNTSFFQGFSEDDKVDYLVGRLATRYDVLECWHAVAEEAEYALKIHRKYEGQVKCGTTLPDEYGSAMRMLQHILNKHFTSQSSRLTDTAIFFPAFADKMSRFLHRKPEDRSPWRSRGEERDEFRKDPLVWGLYHLYDAHVVPGAHDPTFVIGLLDSTIRQAPKRDRGKIDQSLHDHLAGMAAVDEVLSALRFHRPCIGPPLTTAEVLKLHKERPIRREFQSRIVTGGAVVSLHYQDLYPLIEQLLGIKSLEKLSQDSIRDFKTAHSALAEFWKIVKDARKVLYEQMSLPKERIEEILKVMSICSTNEYAAETHRDHEALKKAIREQEAEIQMRALRQAKSRRKILPPPSTPVQTVWGSATETRRQSLTPREKVKTRRSLAENEVPSLRRLSLHDSATSATDDDSQDHTEEDPKIEVNSISLDLFHRMFTPIACAKGTASVKWDDFVAALMDAGCTSKQAGGSAVTFMHPGDGMSAVVIHRPHPDPSINPIMLGSLAKKFGKRMGWEREMFVLRGREAEKGKGKGGGQ